MPSPGGGIPIRGKATVCLARPLTEAWVAAIGVAPVPTGYEGRELVLARKGAGDGEAERSSWRA